jgi:hypothetical protein
VFFYLSQAGGQQNLPDVFADRDPFVMHHALMYQCALTESEKATVGKETFTGGFHHIHQGKVCQGP